MATAYTTVLKLALPVTGELSGTWGDVVNDNITKMLEEAVVGRAAISSWTANAHTLSSADGTTSESRCLMLDLTGTLSATGTLTIPSGFTKQYLVRNGTTGGFAVNVGMATGTTVSVANGTTALVYADGTNTKAVALPTTSGTALLKADGSGGATAASAGTDYAKPDTASSWTANQTFDNSTVKIKGSSTGVTTLTSANAGASNYTVTWPASNTSVLISSYHHTFSGPTAARTYTVPDASVSLGYLNIPAVGTKTSSYSLATTDVGKYVQVGSGGSITIPDATFAEGDVVSVINNTTAGITITCTITNAYIAGTDTDKATMTLATRGVATIFFLSGTACVVTGNVS